MVDRSTSPQYPIRASDVVVDDVLNGMRVTKLQTVKRRGVYAPLTQSGDFIVGGVQVSSYVHVLDTDLAWANQHDVGHFLFYPHRFFCRYFMEYCKRERYIQGYGYTSYLILCGSRVINTVGRCGSNKMVRVLQMTVIVMFGSLLYRLGRRYVHGCWMTAPQSDHILRKTCF
jgi:Hint module